jgi:predicted PurR-regulated permease PerM
MGQEGKTPVAVVFFGSIGGFIGMGFIGLFIGAVLLAVAYELMMDWVQEKT